MAIGCSVALQRFARRFPADFLAFPFPDEDLTDFRELFGAGDFFFAFRPDARARTDFERVDLRFLTALRTGLDFLDFAALFGFARFMATFAGASISTSTTASSTRSSGFGASVQPCASRTAIMVDRMLFHVSGSAITALGNMHPSQQTWLKALLGAPCSSRIQNRAWCGMESFPLGSFGRQW